MTKYKRVKLRVGDILGIPLSDGRTAFGQYMHWDKKMGPLVQIFDLVTVHEIQPEQLENAEPLFPPIFTGLFAAVRTGFWKVIGHRNIVDFIYPEFVSTFYDEKTGKARLWFLWDGEHSTRIGYKLPPEYKQLEYLVVWDPHDIVARIETGEYPYPYGDLIQNNSFQPR
jgi:hypothetical protein